MGNWLADKFSDMEVASARVAHSGVAQCEQAWIWNGFWMEEVDEVS